MRVSRVCALFICLTALTSGINFRKVAEFPDADGRRALCFDTDQDGRRNIVMRAYPRPIQFWEHVGYDKYVLEDTAGPAVRLYDIGFSDADSLIDMVGCSNGWPCPTYVYESPTQHSHPTDIVWADSGVTRDPYSVYITDLDQDGVKELLTSYSRNGKHTCVYENIGDNEYTLVWQDTIHVSSCFVNGDFDLDGQIEFISGGDYGYVHIWECIGNDDYQFIFCDTLPRPGNYDVFSAADMDGNGKPEFMSNSLFDKARLYLFEATDDNIYEYFLVDSIQLPSNWSRAFSVCGDIDADGIEEIVWSTCNRWHIYKATGIHQYQGIYSSDWTGHQALEMNVCDLNANGYPEVIEAWFENGIPSLHAVVIWEIEGVRLHQPNGGEVLHPDQQHLITWEKYDPPGADSFALFYSIDNGFNYDTIVTGLANNDTSYLWTVPNTISDSCIVMIWAYGPPRPGEQEPRGTAWDFSDSLFSISDVSAKEDNRGQITDYSLMIIQNPTLDRNLKIQYSLPKTCQVRLTLYNSLGQAEDILVDDIVSRGIHKLDIRMRLSSGVYFMQLRTRDQTIARKIVKIE